MIVFQVFTKFWCSDRNIENTMSHLYLNEESDYSEENTCENKVFRCSIFHHRKKLNIFTLQLPIFTYSIKIGNLSWCKCQKQPLVAFSETRCSLKFRKIHGKHLCQRKHLWILRNFQEHLFLHNNSGRLLLKCGHYESEVREVNCLYCREVDAMLVASAKIREHEGGISPSSFYGNLPEY